MSALLIERWLDGLEAVPILDGASVSIAREQLRALGAKLAMPGPAIGNLAIAASELATNQLVHARGGVVAARAIERDGVRGVELVAADDGAGIADPVRAIDGGGTPKGLGIGLASVLRLCDEVDLDVRLGEGTCVRARMFAQRMARRREVGIFGRPCEGERASGDDATFVRDADVLRLAVADGLGHGPLARAASSRAMGVVHDGRTRTPGAVLRETDAALPSTRGAVMAVLDLDERDQNFTHAAVGNVGVQVVRHRSTRAFAGSSFVLGSSGRTRPRIHEESAALSPGDVVVMFTDGLTSRTSLREDSELLGRHPIVIAQHLLERFGRHNDDATVLVAS